MRSTRPGERYCAGSFAALAWKRFSKRCPPVSSAWKRALPPEAVEKRAVGGERRAVFFGHDG